MSRTPFLSLATLAALCAAASVQAQAPHSQGSHSAQTKTAQKTPAKATAVKKTSYTAHQKSCMNRYKSYNASSDTYLLKGKKVRCKL